MLASDLSVVAPLVVLYYKWITNTGGTCLEDLLATPLTHAQRRLLLEKVADVDVVFAATSPLRRVARLTKAGQGASIQTN